MSAANDPGPVAGAILYLLVGPLIWAAHLLLAYVSQSGLCAFRVTGVADADLLLIPMLVGGVTVLAAAAIVFALGRPESTARFFRAAAFLDGENGRFMIAVMRLLAALSLVGVLLAGAAALLLSPCAQLR